MAIYRFRVSFEDYDQVIREIDIFPKQTFLDLHIAIQENLGYDVNVSSSFYISNDQWKKGKEIAFLPSEKKKEQKVSVMEGARLNQFIDDPHQKFYYTYNFSRPYDFHVELIKILKEEEGKNYPSVFKSIGAAPKPFNQNAIIESVNNDSNDEKDFDFFNDMAYDDEETDQMDLLDDDEIEGPDEFTADDSTDDSY